MRRGHQTSDVRSNGTATPPLPAGIQVRPLEPSDRGRLVALFKRLSPESRRRRFLGPKPELSERDLRYLTAVDHQWHEALAAVDRRDGSIVGVARYVGHAGRPTAADVALAVADEVQRQGIGTALARCLIGRARANGFDVLTASTLWENRGARLLLRRLGFHARGSEGTVLELELDLWAA
jgi:ribosomal protein S18 acetylase RimI-like enzyme